MQYSLFFIFYIFLGEGKKWLSDNWKLCQPLKNENNIEQLISYLQDIYTNLAMVNYPYKANFLAPLPAYPINVSILIFK